MKSTVFDGERSVKLVDLPKPGIESSRDALVKITLGAVCGSDLHIYHARTMVQPGEPIGHEFVGIVEEIGPEVERFKAGDRVVSSFYSSCGWCAFCRKGWFSQCEHRGIFGYGAAYGGGLGGAQAEYVLVPNADHTLELIPSSVTDEQAIFVGDILATGYFGAERAEIKPGDIVAVVGAGPVGLMATMCAQLFGPARVCVIDMVDSRLEVALELGGTPIDASKTHPVEAVMGYTKDIGADSSIECVGLMSTVDTAIRCVRGGGTISMLGVPSEINSEFPFWHFWDASLTFRSGVCNVPVYMRRLLDLIEAGRLHPEKIISHRMKLDQIEDAYRIFDAREATKIVLTP